MSAALFDSVPAERRDAARSALASAFGAAQVSSIQPILGGASALTYRVQVGGRPYALRLDVRRSPMHDPARGFACMRTAAEAGVSPPLRHADAEAGVAITDFIAARPLTAYPGGPEALARDFGRLIARLQATPAFPVLDDYFNVIGRMMAFLAGSGLFAAGLLEPHMARLETIRQAYPWDPAALVSSHNDPNPRNLIFDGTRLWLIDWETAFRNDPLVDVAIVTQEIAPAPALEDALLRGWLGQAPSAQVRARLTLMKAVIRLYYAGLMLMPLAAAPPAQPHGDLAAPSLAEFRQAIAEGRTALGAPDFMFTLGKMQLAGFLNTAGAPGFDKALSVAWAG